jgi:hypothetical protein
MKLEWSKEGDTWRFREEGATPSPNKVFIRPGHDGNGYIAEVWKADIKWHEAGVFETLEEAKAVAAAIYRIEGERV